MVSTRSTPKITSLSWGHIEVEGFDKPFKDVKVFPGGAREWDWRETGTRHQPGIQPADVEELLQHGAGMIILSQGMHERLQVCPQTLDFLRQKNVPVQVLQTEKAVQRFNALCEKQKVGGLFHSTC